MLVATRSVITAGRAPTISGAPSRRCEIIEVLRAYHRKHWCSLARLVGVCAAAYRLASVWWSLSCAAARKISLRLQINAPPSAFGWLVVRLVAVAVRVRPSCYASPPARVGLVGLLQRACYPLRQNPLRGERCRATRGFFFGWRAESAAAGVSQKNRLRSKILAA